MSATAFFSLPFVARNSIVDNFAMRPFMPPMGHRYRHQYLCAKQGRHIHTITWPLSCHFKMNGKRVMHTGQYHILAL